MFEGHSPPLIDCSLDPTQLLTTAIEEDGEMLAARPSIDCHSSSLVQITNSTSSHHPTMSYSYLHPSHPTTSIDTAETLLMLWKDHEMVSLEDIFHPSDRLAYQHFKLVILLPPPSSSQFLLIESS
jgi:enolase